MTIKPIAAAIEGAKGGGDQRTPVESADSLRSIAYFRILDLVSEGEIGGLVNGTQSIYLDETPLANADGSINFQNTHVEARTGTQDQDPIPGYPAVENEISIGVELKSASPWVRAISNTALSAARVTIGFPALSKANTSNGDIGGYSISYTIDVQTDGGAWVNAYNGTATGKTTTKYQRSHRIDLPAATTGWSLRVTRTTVNANSSSIADTTTIDSYTEIVDAKLAYPNSALVAVSGDAAHFSNIPSRAYDLWGRIISVPSNYDPLARTYAGVWDGSFKPAWSNNPAWVFYDLVTHPRYGLGNLVAAAQMDKWALYSIAQYCDGLVPDGKGGQEPRFTCNVYLQTADDAYKLLSDLASAFRGLSYWANGAISATADMPSDPAYLYTAANVIDGRFTYASSPRKTRYTTALVTWNDPANFYRAKVEYVQDTAGVLRYGIQPTQVTAFGCTSQGQAQRAGQWLLLTSRLEYESVTFSVGLDGVLAAPGQVIRVQDQARAGKRQGGRIHSATATAITVDKAPDAVAVGDNLTCTLPSGQTETHAITGIAGAVLSVAAPGFSVAPNAESGWVTESTTLAAQTFRVVAVTEDNKQGEISFTLSAVKHDASKFAAIDGSAILQPPPAISNLPATIQAPVASVTVAENHVILQGTAQTVATISWPPIAGADTYQVEWRRDAGDWINAGSTSGLSIDVPGVYSGSYVARVRAVSASGVVSLPTLSAATAIVGKTAPNAPPTLTATGGQLQIVLNWAWPAGVNVEDTNYTEVWVSPTSTMTDGSSVGAVAYPGTSYTISGLLPQQTRYAWVRLVDKSGNVGAWSVPANAISGTTTDLFKPVQDQIDTLDTTAGDLQTQINSAQAAITQEVTDRTTAVSNEANARATAIINEQNTRAAAVTSEATTRQSADDSLATQISLVSAGSGEQFDSAKIWYFDTDLESWTGNGTPTMSDGWLRPANNATDPYVTSPTGLALAGQSYRFAKLRIKKVGAPAWVGEIRWRLVGDAAGAWRGPATLAAPSFDANGVTAIAWEDIAWWPGTIDQVRIDLSPAQTATDYFLIDWIALGRPTPGAGVALVQNETSARVAADSSEATQRSTLATQLRGSYTGTDVTAVTSGLVYSESQARVSADSALSSRASTLEARMPTGTGTLATAASVTDEASARATADSALSTRTSTMEARMPTGTGTLGTQADTSANAAAISTEQTVRATADSAMAADISLLGAHNSGKTAFILNQSTVQVDNAGTTLGSYISSVNATTNTLQTNINTEQSARISGDTANSNATTAVSSRVTAIENTAQNLMVNPTGGAGFTFPASYAFGWVGGSQQQMTTRTELFGNAGPMFACAAPGTGSVDQGFGITIPQAASSVPITLSADMDARVVASGTMSVQLRFLDSSGTEINTSNRPQVNATNGLGAMKRYTVTGTTAAGTAIISMTVRFTGTMSSSSVIGWRNIKLEIGSVATPYSDNATPIANASAITTLNTTVTNNGTQISANASAINAVQVRMPSGSGVVATAASVTAVQNQINASYTLQLNVNGYVSGIVAQNNGAVSNLVIVADNFSILPSTGTGLRTEFSAGNWRVYDASGTLRVRMGVW